jgi:hypothetical protein
MARRPLTTTLSEQIHELLDKCLEFGCANRNDLIEKGVMLYVEYWRRTAGVCPDLLAAMETMAERISLSTSRDIATQAATEEVGRIIKTAASDPALIDKYPQAAEVLLALHATAFGTGDSVNEQEDFAHVFQEAQPDIG